MCYWCGFTHTLLCFIIIIIVIAVFTVVAVDRGCIWGQSGVCDVRFDFYCRLLQKSLKNFIRSLVCDTTHLIVNWSDWSLTSSSSEVSVLSSEPAAAAATTFCNIRHSVFYLSYFYLLRFFLFLLHLHPCLKQKPVKRNKLVEALCLCSFSSKTALWSLRCQALKNSNQWRWSVHKVVIYQPLATWSHWPLHSRPVRFLKFIIYNISVNWTSYVQLVACSFKAIFNSVQFYLCILQIWFDFDLFLAVQITFGAPWWPWGGCLLCQVECS